MQIINMTYNNWIFFKQNIEVCFTIHNKEYWPKYCISQIFRFDWAQGLSQQQQKTKSMLSFLMFAKFIW